MIDRTFACMCSPTHCPPSLIGPTATTRHANQSANWTNYHCQVLINNKRLTHSHSANFVCVGVVGLIAAHSMTNWQQSNGRSSRSMAHCTMPTSASTQSLLNNAQCTNVTYSEGANTARGASHLALLLVLAQIMLITIVIVAIIAGTHYIN